MSVISHSGLPVAKCSDEFRTACKEQKHGKSCRHNVPYDFRHVVINAQIDSKGRAPHFIASSSGRLVDCPLGSCSQPVFAGWPRTFRSGVVVDPGRFPAPLGMNFRRERNAR